MYKRFEKIQLLVLLGVFCLSLTGFADEGKSSKRRYISLTVGLTHDEDLPYVPKDATFKGDFRNFSVVEFAPELNRLRFTPKSKVGIGTLTIHNPKGDKLFEIILDVKKSNLTKIAQEIQSLLNEIDGIQIKIMNNKVIVDGQVLLPKDVDRIHSVIKQYKDQAASLVTLNPSSENKIADIIEREINNPDITVKSRNGKFLLEGTADPDEKVKAEVIAKTYVPDVVVREAVADGKVQERRLDAVINLIQPKPPAEAEPPKLIQLVVHFVELKRDYNKGFRIQWTPTLDDKSGITFSSDSRQAGGVVSSITGTINNLLPKLNWAKSAGQARILQSTTVIVQDKEKGEVISEVQIPFQSTNQMGAIVTSTTGVGLNSAIVPRLISPRSDSIELNMNFSFSSYVGESSSGPIINKRVINTKLTVKSGQSAAVGGLISSSNVTEYNRLPANVADNPIISLYSSKSFQRNQSQFVAFVTPILKSSASEGSEKIKKKFRLRD